MVSKISRVRPTLVRGRLVTHTTFVLTWPWVFKYGTHCFLPEMSPLVSWWIRVMSYTGLTLTQCWTITLETAEEKTVVCHCHANVNTTRGWELTGFLHNDLPGPDSYKQSKRNYLYYLLLILQLQQKIAHQKPFPHCASCHPGHTTLMSVESSIISACSSYSPVAWSHLVYHTY